MFFNKTQNIFVFIDVTKGIKEKHLRTLEDSKRVLDEAGISLKLEKRQIANKEAEWLGYKSSAEDMKPILKESSSKNRQTAPKKL